MATIEWPRSLCPVETSVDVVSRTVVGPPVIAGSQQGVASSAGVWRATLNGIPLNRDDRILLWRALEVLIEGRSNSVCVPIRGTAGVAPVPPGGILSAEVPHSDGTSFSDGTRYRQTLSSVLTIGADYGATSLAIASAGIAPLVPGHMFSIGCRLYRVKSATLVVGVWTVGIWPPLREPVAAGDRVEFGDLVCKMRLTADDAMATPLLLGRIGVASVTFIEDVL